jgi:UDP-glucose 4-epimerase
VALVEAGLQPVILDNFSNSHPAVLQRLEQLTGRRVPCERGDVLDTAWVAEVLRRHRCVAAVHFAGFKAVGESVQQPLMYYRNNVSGLVSLLEAMAATPACRSVVFSSSATVYGDPATVPIDETFPCAPESPYAHSKRMCEDILASLRASDPSWRTGVLRYFNPVGAHPSGRIGEDPQGIPNNLVPYIAQVAVGRREKLMVFGGDYDTPDGTCLRDYIHVVDLAGGHVAALDYVAERPGVHRWNLGSGKGTSVLEMLHAFEQAVGHPLPYEITGRRAGDLPAFWADASSALADLSWSTTKTVDQMCEDHWRWQKNNPLGYSS